MTDRHAKQIIVMRKDLKMRRGKEIAQGAHAAMAWLSLRMQNPLQPGNKAVVTLSDAEMAWIGGRFKKVVVQVNSLESLTAVHEAAIAAGLESRLITDAGITEFKVPTVTCCAIGPDWDEQIDPITGELELY